MTTGPSVALPAGVVVEHLPDRAPAADVGPTDVGWNHGGELGALHDRVVDRFLRRLCERLGGQPQEIEIARAAGDGRLRGLRHGRLEALDLAQHGSSAEQEIAAVPEIALRRHNVAAVAASGFSTNASTARADAPLSFRRDGYSRNR